MTKHSSVKKIKIKNMSLNSTILYCLYLVYLNSKYFYTVYISEFVSYAKETVILLIYDYTTEKVFWKICKSP